MLQSVRMKMIELVVLERDVRKVTRLLGRLGAVHLVSARDDEAVTRLVGEDDQLEDRLAHVQQLQGRVQTILSGLGLQPSGDATPEEFTPVEQVEKRVESIESSVSESLDRVSQIDSELNKLRELEREVSTFSRFNAPLEEINNLSFLHFAIGSIPRGALAQLQDEVGDKIVLLPMQPDEKGQSIIAATSKKNRWSLQTALDEVNFRSDAPTDEMTGIPSEIIKQLDHRRATLVAEKKQLQRALADTAGQHGPALQQDWRRLALEITLLNTERNFGRTWSSYLISGWVPADKVHQVLDEALKITEQRMAAEVHDAEQLERAGHDVPVLMKHNPLVRPFEMIVQGMGFPSYNEIEPTAFVAVSFLVMFGLMFGDVGHGAVLGVVGAILIGHGSRTRNIRLKDIGVLIGMAGLSAIVFGFLYGSLFGIPHSMARPLEPILFEPLDDLAEGHQIMSLPRILTLTIAYGVLFVSIGVMVNIVNRLRRGDLLHGVFHRFGVLGLLFYWCVLAMLPVGFWVSGPLQDGLLMSLGIAAAVLFVGMFVGEPVVAKLRGKETLFEHGIATWFMEATIESLETIIAYLSSTVSFARIGAFALAHAGLCVAIYKLVEMVYPTPGGVVWAGLIAIAGNLLVVALEGMVVTIQTVRLEYYEFFSKFLEGQGKPFKPFELK